MDLNEYLYVEPQCTDAGPHAPHRAFINTIHDDEGKPVLEVYEVRCQLCGVTLETFEVEISEEKEAGGGGGSRNPFSGL